MSAAAILLRTISSPLGGDREEEHAPTHRLKRLTTEGVAVATDSWTPDDDDDDAVVLNEKMGMATEDCFVEEPTSIMDVKEELSAFKRDLLQIVKRRGDLRYVYKW